MPSTSYWANIPRHWAAGKQPQPALLRATTRLNLTRRWLRPKTAACLQRWLANFSFLVFFVFYLFIIIMFCFIQCHLEKLEPCFPESNKILNNLNLQNKKQNLKIQPRKPCMVRSLSAQEVGFEFEPIRGEILTVKIWWWLRAGRNTSPMFSCGHGNYVLWPCGGAFLVPRNWFFSFFS